MYAVRKIRDTFRANKSLSDFGQIDKEIMYGKQSLELIRRQVCRYVNSRNMYMVKIGYRYLYV